MIKVVTLLFKRPDLSAEEFRDYYESLIAFSVRNT